jgi:hypothetical protein
VWVSQKKPFRTNFLEKDPVEKGIFTEAEFLEMARMLDQEMKRKKE